MNFNFDISSFDLKGLEVNPRDAWSTHSMAHVLEMMGRQPEGVKFMSGTERDWSVRANRSFITFVTLF